MAKSKKYRIIISGGGTGGHIFPALSIAGALRRRIDADILFVGAENRMEMEKVPAAGYKIVGLPVAGFNRKNLFKNISVVIKLIKSIAKAHSIIRRFKPDIAIGVGGYASGPILKAAQSASIPTLLQEQNSYAGVTNKLLARKAKRICVAYSGMERFFDAEKIVLTGNPVRRDILTTKMTQDEARASFGFDIHRRTVLAIGGSLGAGTLNKALENDIERLTQNGIQVIWQTGKNFGDRAVKAANGLKGVVVTQFITDMAKAYAAADLVVSRAGAGSISELELLGKPAILIPSPNVAEDHQTKNARALSDKNAAIMIADSDAVNNLADTILKLTDDDLNTMSRNISTLALRNSDEKIVDCIMQLIER